MGLVVLICQRSSHPPSRVSRWPYKAIDVAGPFAQENKATFAGRRRDHVVYLPIVGTRPSVGGSSDWGHTTRTRGCFAWWLRMTSSTAEIQFLAEVRLRQRRRNTPLYMRPIACCNGSEDLYQSTQAQPPLERVAGSPEAHAGAQYSHAPNSRPQLTSVFPIRRIASATVRARGHEPDGPLGSDVRLHVVRAHVSAAGAKGGRMAKPSAARAAVSRPRSTSRLTWMGGRWRFTSPEGQASDSPQFEILLDLGPDITPRAAVGDKGYDSKANRSAARERSIGPVIPFRSSAKNRPISFPKRSIAPAPASSNSLASSSGSNVSRSAARRRPRTTAPLLHLLSASSSSNPSTPPSQNPWYQSRRPRDQSRPINARPKQVTPFRDLV